MCTRRPCKTTPSRLFALYLVLAGIERFLVELIRRNDHVLLGLTQPQLFAVAMSAAGLALLAGKAARTTVVAEPTVA